MPFGRFTESARRAVEQARQEALEPRHDSVGPEHLVLALVRCDDGPAGQALRAQGVRLDDVRGRVLRRTAPSDDPLDAEALAAIGIDLEEVRRAADEAFGAGALERAARRGRRGRSPFTREAKKALELSLRHAIRLKHNHIGTGHVLLGLVHDADQPAHRLLREAGADLGELRAELESRIAAEAA